MSKSFLTCILCPMSCSLELTQEEGRITGVTGNSCKLGAGYAEKEYTFPTRTLTSTVEIDNGVVDRLPVKTNGEIPKVSIIDAMREISGLRVTAPITRGQVICYNVAGTGVDVVATRSLGRR